MYRESRRAGGAGSARERRVRVSLPGQLAAALVRAPDIYLDAGERALWAHALTRHDAWVLCGPDRASLRFGVQVGYRAKDALPRQFTTQWLDKVLSEPVVQEQKRS